VFKTKPAKVVRSFKERVEAMLDFYVKNDRAPRKIDLKLLREAREAANKAGEAYTSRGNAGFAWLNSSGKFTCTFNREDNLLYTRFVTWDALKARKAARENAAEGTFV
tara:strand:- start:234 stop:557 length:324 start_codon:yes stop_codon:yes gene_type:complete